MKATNSWPDVNTYVTLTPDMTLATTPWATAAYIEQEPQDDETDLYVPHSTEAPFTVPHLYASFSITGPLISEFPIQTQALIDIGCPSTVISSELVEHLGLRQYPLPPSEDNLLSLSESPLHCKEYVKLDVKSGQGQ
jgi:hypothetical protein